MPRSTMLDSPSVAFLGNYLPRRCGIATFTTDLCEAVATQAGSQYDVFAVAMNDVPEGYPYPSRVRFEVRQAVQADYRLAAEFLNIQQISAVCMQHEYGIYGGRYGSHVLSLLRRLRRPLVTTLHTVLKEPNQQQRLILREIAELSTRLVVMSETAYGILNDGYDIPIEKVAMVPHGIPDVPFVDPNFYKDQFGVEGRRVMLTFGLLSPGKGVEYGIDALPEIVAKHPDFVYVILGETHPHIKRESGEEYRNALHRRVEKLGMGDHVQFVNRFVEMSELCEYLGMAEVYLTPYLNLDQITSGTLAYALGTGKATVSTPYWYAQEMLADGRGAVVPPKDPKAIARKVNELLDNQTELHAMRKRAYTFCRKMTWKRVAQDYLDLFAEASESWSAGTAVAVGAPQRKVEDHSRELPELDLRHLRIMTDETGMLRHCLFTTPHRAEGYATDDNAQALVVTALHWTQNQDESILPLMHTYLGFLAHALNEETGRFRNFMGYDRHWSEAPGSEDSHARALWALSIAVALCPHESQIALATRLFRGGLKATEQFASPRAWAYTIVGLHAYLRRFAGDSDVRRTRAALTERLSEQFKNHMDEDWPWCEDAVTYANAKLPHALLMSGKWMQHDEWIDMGKRALSWLLEIQTTPENTLSIIGTDGWYPRGGTPARFDQQPAEAYALLDACIEAYHVTRESEWIDQAHKVFNWFLGDNDMRTPVFDFTTGGCHDRLKPDRVDPNQGAEGTLSWLLSLLLMQELEMERNFGSYPVDRTTDQRPISKAIRPSGPVVGGQTEESHAVADRDD